MKALLILLLICCMCGCEDMPHCQYCNKKLPELQIMQKKHKRVEQVYTCWECLNNKEREIIKKRGE